MCKFQGQLDDIIINIYVDVALLHAPARRPTHHEDISE